MENIKLIATSTFGLEAIVKDEVKRLGYTDVKVENGKVEFSGDLSAIARTNIWLRSADRIRLKIAEFKATTFEELFEKTKELPWADWLPEDAEFPVDGKSVKSTLFSVSDCQAIVKKAVVESMKKRYKKQWFDETGPLYKIEVALLKDVATLTIDTTGPGLHKRGYREWIGTAPLKETMAAAMIHLARWKGDRYLIDPFCGSGTIPIEAALIAKNIAPGLNRTFVSEEWPNIDKKIWQDVRSEARSAAKFDEKVEIIGTDIDEEVLKVARRNAQEAGVFDDIHFQQMDVSDLSTKKKYGAIICNPPYGERISEKTEVEELYKSMGQAFNKLDTWSFFVLSPNEEFEKLFGKRATKKRKLYNGNIKVDLYQFFGPLPPRKRKEQ